MPRYSTEVAASRLTPGQFVDTTYQGTVAAKAGDYLLCAGPFKAVVAISQILESGATFQTGTPQLINEPLTAGATLVEGVILSTPDATIEVFVNDVSAGTTSAVANAWSLVVAELAEADVVTVTALAIDPGATVSEADTTTVEAA